MTHRFQKLTSPSQYILSLSILIFHQKTPVNQEFPRKGGRAEPNEVQACYPRERLTGSCRVSFDSSVPVPQRTFSVWIRAVPGLYQNVYSLIRIITTYQCQIILSPGLYQTVSTVLILVVNYLYQNCILSIYSYDLFQMCMYQICRD